MTRRPYQQTALAAFIKEPDRCWALLWERQSGKSTTLADFALYEMLRHPGRTVIYASASLLLPRKLLSKPPFARISPSNHSPRKTLPASNISPTTSALISNVLVQIQY